jgi:hypothetical protein
VVDLEGRPAIAVNADVVKRVMREVIGLQKD